MALSKLKDISLIKTSPKDRLPVRTMVSAFDEEVIKDAIQREVDRGGQCFFLHNRVSTIRTIASRLEALLPNVKFRIGHGQMSGKELESLIIDFYHHRSRQVRVSPTLPDTWESRSRKSPCLCLFLNPGKHLLRIS